jgi:acetyl esterase/lipase
VRGSGGNAAGGDRGEGIGALGAAAAALVAVAAFTPAVPGGTAEARASVRGNGSTRNGDPPIVRLVVGATETMRAPRRAHQMTYAYGPHAAQRFDAYWTDGPAGRRPGIMLLHGGYWLAGDKSTWRSTARRLAARGYVVFSANYRLSRQAPWPAQLDDAAAALGYVQRHARRFHLDPRRMAVVGSSAGGQLATMLGADGTRHIRGVVALSPVNAPYLAFVAGGRRDATAPQRKLRRAVTRLVRCVPSGAGTASCLDRMGRATPRATAAAVPMLFVHSRHDFVPPAQSAGVRDTLALAGVTVELKSVPGAAHGGGLLRARRVYAMVVDWIDSVTAGRTTP